MSKQVINIVVLMGGILESVRTFETEDLTMVGEPGDNIGRIEQVFIDAINEQLQTNLTEEEKETALEGGYFETGKFTFYLRWDDLEDAPEPDEGISNCGNTVHKIYDEGTQEDCGNCPDCTDCQDGHTDD